MCLGQCEVEIRHLHSLKPVVLIDRHVLAVRHQLYVLSLAEPLHFEAEGQA